MLTNPRSLPRRWGEGYRGEGKGRLLSVQMGRTLLLGPVVKQLDQTEVGGVLHNLEDRGRSGNPINYQPNPEPRKTYPSGGVSPMPPALLDFRRQAEQSGTIEVMYQQKHEFRGCIASHFLSE